MPDLDMIDRASAPGWHTPFRLLANEDTSPEEIGRAMLRVLDVPNPWAGLSHAYPQLLEVASCVASLTAKADAEQKIVDLYRRYCDEWRHFPVQGAGGAASRAA